MPGLLYLVNYQHFHLCIGQRMIMHTFITIKQLVVSDNYLMSKTLTH